MIEGVQVETVVSGTDLPVSSTGNFNIITLDHTRWKPGHFRNEIGLAGSECLDGKKIVHFTPRKIISSSPFNKNSVYLLPKQFDEEVATPHFPALGAALTVFPQEHADYVVVKVESPCPPQSGVVSRF